MLDMLLVMKLPYNSKCPESIGINSVHFLSVDLTVMQNQLFLISKIFTTYVRNLPCLRTNMPDIYVNIVSYIEHDHLKY